MLNYELEKFRNDGLVVYRNFFDRELITKLRSKSESIFQIQFDHFGYRGDYKENMISLFNEHIDVFINCGKQIQQGLVELYKLSINDKLLDKLKELGLEFVNMSTRPVLYFNHPKLAKEEHYYKTPIHQDWPSIQSSSDSLVVWVPLVDVTPDNGAVIFYPKTHKLGCLPNEVEGGFAKVKFDREGYEKFQPSMLIGDIVIFSTLLVHESGDIKDESIRWSCHFRYNNLLDKDFINRGFPNPYIYKPEFKTDEKN